MPKLPFSYGLPSVPNNSGSPHHLVFLLNTVNSSRLGSKKRDSLILPLWAVAEDNECCTLEERLKNHFSKTPIHSSDGESTQNPILTSKGAVLNHCLTEGHHQTKNEFFLRLLKNNLIRTCKHAYLWFIHGAHLTLSFIYFYRISPSMMTSVPAVPVRQI